MDISVDKILPRKWFPGDLVAKAPWGRSCGVYMSDVIFTMSKAIVNAN